MKSTLSSQNEFDICSSGLLNSGLKSSDSEESNFFKDSPIPKGFDDVDDVKE